LGKRIGFTTKGCGEKLLYLTQSRKERQEKATFFFVP
jgi:hypothetical protein